jgi:hypothetical protein
MKQATPDALLALRILPLFACAALGLSGGGSQIPDVKPRKVCMAKMPSRRALASHC